MVTLTKASCRCLFFLCGPRMYSFVRYFLSLCSLPPFLPRSLSLSFCFPVQVILAGIAANLSVQVDDLDFSGLTFLQGSNFSVEKEFDVGSVELSSVLGESSGLRSGLEIDPV